MYSPSLDSAQCLQPPIFLLAVPSQGTQSSLALVSVLSFYEVTESDNRSSGFTRYSPITKPEPLLLDTYDKLHI